MLYFKGLLETYRSGRNELDSKSSCPLTRARGFESHRLRHNFIAGVNEKYARAGYALAAAIKHLQTKKHRLVFFLFFAARVRFILRRKAFVNFRAQIVWKMYIGFYVVDNFLQFGCYVVRISDIPQHNRA